MARHKNTDWNLPEKMQDWEMVMVPLLMDIRDELQALRGLANCYRIPRALDALAEMGADLRRKKRLTAKRRAAAKKGR